LWKTEDADRFRPLFARPIAPQREHTARPAFRPFSRYRQLGFSEPDVSTLHTQAAPFAGREQILADSAWVRDEAVWRAGI
jgi:hypothetical protein